MNKNLKKVISSTVALALSLGSLSAFAASYTDVTDSAEYAKAVNELSALGIINGYDDGTFKPDAKVTRAEVTKMVVAARAMTDAANASANQNTQFSDVKADHWAAGFISVGSSESGFINGMGDGTFKPEANVTYAQLVKMLVAVLGYDGMAKQNGGYPTGYLTIGDNIGVTKGLRLNANDELTRGQVAMLIDNSINIPLLVTTVWSQANPEYEIKDGKGKYFQSLLTDYHDTYKVEGKIVATSKSDTTLDSDEARFEIAVADRFDDDEWFVRNDEDVDRDRTVIVADGIDVVSELFSYSTALIHKNSDDEYELISLNSTAKSKTAELVADAIDDENSIYKDKGAAGSIANYKPLKYYATDAKTGKVTEYKLADGDKVSNEAELWVNGVKIDDWTEENLKEYLVDNRVGTVTLVDAPQEGKATTDGYYDYVLVTYYKSGIVEDVSSDGTIRLDEGEKLYEDGPDAGAAIKTIELDQDKVEDDELQYTITLDGKEISYTDLQEDDVIAVAFDVTADGFENSTFYDIIVTRGTVEGKVTSQDTEDDTYTVGGTTYKYDEKKLSAGYDEDAVGMEVELFVDAFGRIVKLDEASSSKKYAILDHVWQENGDDTWMARIITPDRSVLEYEIKDDNKEYIVSDDEKYATTVDYLAKIAYNTTKAGLSDPAKQRADIQDRVVTYKVNSSNEIHTIKPTTSKAVSQEEYDERSNKIGSLKLNGNAAIVDASKYVDTEKRSDLKSVSSLVDETKYTAYGFDKLSDGTYSFVLITKGIGDYTDDTQIAVFVKSSIETNKDGDSNDAITVLYNGEEKTYLLDSIEADDLGLDKGDVITFKTNSSDEIDDVVTVAKLGLCDGTSRKQYDLNGYTLDPNANLAKIPAWVKTDKNDTDVKLDFGVIIDKASGDFTIVEYGETASENKKRTYDITDNTKVYVYNYKESAKNALFVGTKSDISKISIPSDAEDDNDNIVDWSELDEYSINYAFVKALDDEAEQVVVIVGPGKSKY